jgi:hypothetical protein
MSSAPCLPCPARLAALAGLALAPALLAVPAAAQAMAGPFVEGNIATGAFPNPPTSPRAVSAADFDGDTDVDVVAANFATNSITWYENVGGAGAAWNPRPVSSTIGGARSVITADVNGDTFPDIVCVGESGDEVVWFENDGFGITWTERVVSSTASSPVQVHAADIDGDTDLDLVVAQSSNLVLWYENINGDGLTWTGWVTPFAIPTVTSVATGHLNGDGFLDIVTTSSLDDQVIWLNNANGDGLTWGGAVLSPGNDGAWSVATGDIDGDTVDDVVSASLNGDAVVWHENVLGDATAWMDHPIDTTGNGPSSVEVEDLDGDGDQDVLACTWFDNSVTWYENTAGDGSAWTPHELSTGAQFCMDVHVADLDGDTELDVISASANDNSVDWYQNLAFPSEENIRVGSPANPAAFLPGQTSPPYLGATWDPIIDHTTFAPASIFDFYSLSLGPLNIPTSYGTILCTTPLIQVVELPGNPLIAIIPDDPSLIGAGVCCQAASWSGGEDLLFTNAIDIVLGTY